MTDTTDWVDSEIANGRYKVLNRIGEGSMGHVYRAFDRNLQTEVVVKCPIPAEKSLEAGDFLERFAREVRSLVSLSHPHIVKIIDVGSHEGAPYVVMQYLSGGTLKDRMAEPPSGPRAMAPGSLIDWLRDVARALDFVHAEGFVHRDVKPANILFDRYGNAFLSDFGIIKGMATGSKAWMSSALTAPGLLLGTPNYVAPEIVMGMACDGRADQYSLAMTVHEALSGSSFIEGPTPSATLVNQIKLELPPLNDLLPGVPRSLSEAVRRGLAKDPFDRFPDCSTFAKEVLAELPTDASSSSTLTWALVPGGSTRGDAGYVPCPACRTILPVDREHVGERVRCETCHATVLVQAGPDGTMALNLIKPPTASWTDPGWEDDPKAPTALTAPARGGLTRAGARWKPFADSGSLATLPGRDPSRVSGARKWGAYLLLALVSVVAALSIRSELLGRTSSDSGRVTFRPRHADVPPIPDEPQAHSSAADTATEGPVAINIAYGTEKEEWLGDAIAEFKKTEAGRRIEIHPIGMGSLEGEKAVLKGLDPKRSGPAPTPIHVWSPASSAVRDLLEAEWYSRRAVDSTLPASPILRSENLALTPMVFVMWKERHDAFVKKYQKVDFRTIAEAMHQKGGWGTIAGHPEWSSFKFSHTDPEQSNSGLLTFVLMAYDFAHKQRDLTMEDVVDPKFLDWMATFERGLTREGSTLSHSTGTLMKDMVLRGPSQFDGVMVYENLAIDFLEAAEERWGPSGEIYVTYPDPNIWNEHPYYILDVPWSDERHRAAAAEFLDFLMSEPIQEKALEHGLRPGNPAVGVNAPDSPLVKFVGSGVRLDVPPVCEPPPAAVILSLIDWHKRHPR